LGRHGKTLSILLDRFDGAGAFYENFVSPAHKRF